MDSKKVAKQQDPSLTPHLTGEGEESEEDKEKIMTRAGEDKKVPAIEVPDDEDKKVPSVKVGEDKKVPAIEVPDDEDKKVLSVKIGEDKKVPAIEVPDDRLENDEDKKAEGVDGGSAESAVDVDDVEKIESMVDEITILEAHVLNDVYGFQGVSELTPFEGDARNQRRGIVTRLKDVSKFGYAEIDLIRLKTWCKDLRFSPILETPVDGKYKWIYGMIVIDPTASALSTKRNQHQ
jgi:hypothetical protein